MHQNASPRALITGASSGIGYELAKCFARDGISLVLVARREEPLRAVQHELTHTYGIEVAYQALDLSGGASRGPLRVVPAAALPHPVPG